MPWEVRDLSKKHEFTLKENGLLTENALKRIKDIESNNG